LVELSNYGIKNGMEIFILAILPNRHIAYPLNSRVRYISPNYEYRSGFSFKLRSFSFLKENIKKISPDVCLSFSETFNPLAIVAARTCGVPIYISDRSNPLKQVGSLQNIMKKVLYPLANGIVAQTLFAKQIFEKRKLNKNIKAIPNPLREVVDNFRISGQRQFKKSVIVSVGRLVPSKNFQQLIN